MAVVAEWLRRWTRNPLGSARAGSNPADCACFSILNKETYFTLNLTLKYRLVSAHITNVHLYSLSMKYLPALHECVCVYIYIYKL